MDIKRAESLANKAASQWLLTSTHAPSTSSASRGREVYLFRQSHAATLFRCGEYLLRVSHDELQTKREIAASRIQLNVPDVAFMKAAFPPFITREGEVTCWQWENKTRDAEIDDIAVVAAAMFDVQPPRNFGKVDVMSRINKNFVLLKKETRFKKSECEILEVAHRKAQEIWLDLGSKNVGVTHGDLSAHNIIVSAEKLVIVDLETVGVGPQGWDMTQVVGGGIFGENEQRVDSAWSRYVSWGGGSLMQEMELFVFVMVLAGASWCLAHKGMSPEHEKQSKVRLRSLAQIMDGASFHEVETWTLL